MLDTLLATLAILITWAAWAAAFVAIGAVVFPRGVAGRAAFSERNDLLDRVSR